MLVEQSPSPEPAAPRRTASRFERLAGWSTRHRWWALVSWLAVLVAVSIGAQLVGADYRDDVSLPGTESQRALDTLRERSPQAAGSTVQIVLADPDGLRTPQQEARVTGLLEKVRGLPSVVDVRSPFTEPGALNGDGTIGYATVILAGETADVPAHDVRALVDTARQADGDGLRVAVGGDAVVATEEGGGGPAEGLGLLAALVILVLLFGSVLAAGLPIVIAVFAVGTAMGLVVLASHVATVASYTTPLMVLVGLGVGIDYALLLFSRYRGELLAGVTGEEATRRAVDTAGRTVLFAGTTVILALLGLVVLGLGSLQGVAVAVALTVATTMVAALVLLPALLAVLSRRIERAVRRRAERGSGDGARWAAWSTFVQRRPWTAALLALVALLALAAPVLGMRLGIADPGNGDPTKTSRQAYDLLARGFGPGFNGPLVVVVDTADTGGGDPRAAAERARPVLAGTPGVAGVSPALPTADGRTATIVVFPQSAPQDTRTAELVRRLRTDVLPPLRAEGGAVFLVGGTTAATVDFSAAVADRLPFFVAVVVGLSSLLLVLVFRSLLIPLKAAVLNLLSVCASLGVVTAVFQQGFLADALGVQPGPIEAFVPVLIFAIAFGLSMDYEIFLLARMHEHWEEHHDAPAAIRYGVATTGRIVTAAAAIMVVVFGSFLFDPGRMLKQFGLGLAVAVLVDALVIRCLIVPAVMQLLGRWAWWLPVPLARRLPRMPVATPRD